MLAHAEDWEGFRHAARSLLRADVAPTCVHWRIADEAQGNLDLFGGADEVSELRPWARPETGVEGSSGHAVRRDMERAMGIGAESRALPAALGPADLRLPRRLLEALRLVILHRAPDRLHCLYRFLWRWRHEPALRSDPLDPDVKTINDYYREVRHDACRMLGLVRFRILAARGDAGIESEMGGEDGKNRWGGQAMRAMQDSRAWRVAWHEPRHRVLRLVAPHFVRRFPGHCWAILTPDACATWDTVRLAFHAGAKATDAPPPDAGEALWLTYYANHFNATRRNPAALRRCMPTDYWKNLPESGLIAALLATR